MRPAFGPFHAHHGDHRARPRPGGTRPGDDDIGWPRRLPPGCARPGGPGQSSGPRNPDSNA